MVGAETTGQEKGSGEPGLPEQTVVEGFPQPSELAAGIGIQSSYSLIVIGIILVIAVIY